MGVRPRTALALGAAVAVTAVGGPPARAAEAGAVRRAIAWSLVQAGPNERSLEVSFAYGGCQRAPRAEAVESRAGLRIIVSVEVPQQRAVACPDFLRLARARVALRSPIRGRPLLGSWNVSSAGAVPSRVVPRVIGLAPGDARRVLAGWKARPGLHAVTRVRHGRGGVPRVTAQSPSPGAAAPGSGLVVLHVDAP